MTAQKMKKSLLENFIFCAVYNYTQLRAQVSFFSFTLLTGLPAKEKKQYHILQKNYLSFSYVKHIILLRTNINLADDTEIYIVQCIFRKRSSFIFLPKSSFLFTEKRNIIFTNHAENVTFQCAVLGRSSSIFCQKEKTSFSGKRNSIPFL